MNKYISCFGLIFMFLLSGCEKFTDSSKPDNLIEEDTYIDLLVEFQLIRTHYNAEPDSVNKDSLTSLVYEKYGVDEEQYKSSHTYYQAQVREQIQRTEEAIQRLESLQQKIELKMDSLSTDSSQTDSLISF